MCCILKLRIIISHYHIDYPLHKMVLKGLKSYKKKDTYILSPVRSHGQTAKFKIPSQRIILIPLNARQALKRDTNISLKKADKGTTPVALNIEDKIKEGQTQLDNRENYRPLVNPMVEETNLRVQQLISELYLGNLIDEMTKTWLCQTP